MSGRVGIGIAAQPEVLDEGFALFIVAQVLEGFPLFVGNDVGHVLIKPGLVGALQLLPDCLLGLKLLLVGALALQRIGFLILAGGGSALRRRVWRLLGLNAGSGD